MPDQWSIHRSGFFQTRCFCSVFVTLYRAFSHCLSSPWRAHQIIMQWLVDHLVSSTWIWPNRTDWDFFKSASYHGWLNYYIVALKSFMMWDFVSVLKWWVKALSGCGDEAICSWPPGWIMEGFSLSYASPTTDCRQGMVFCGWKSPGCDNIITWLFDALVKHKQ
jgi:hypothetical protein